MISRFIFAIESWAWRELALPGGLTRFWTNPIFDDFSVPLCRCGEDWELWLIRQNKWRGHSCPRHRIPSRYYCTVTLTFFDGMPFATTSNTLAPVSIPEGTSKFVNTVVVPVATPMVLWSCV